MVDRPSGSGGPDPGSMLADGPLSPPLMKNVPPPAPGPGLWLRKVLYLVDQMGIVSLLTVRTARAFFTRPFEARAIVYQLESVGVKSVGIASVTAVFIGMVMAVQFAISLQKFGAMESAWRVLGLSFARELAPTLPAVIVGGRVAAGLAAEVGSMAVTEQVDAIRALGADPVKKLVLPRVAASVIAMPILAMLALVFGFSGGMAVTSSQFDIPPEFFRRTALNAVAMSEYRAGICKTPFFGAIIALVGCHFGLITTGGTEGVGKATTRTVVVISIAILIADFFLTKALFWVFG